MAFSLTQQHLCLNFKAFLFDSDKVSIEKIKDDKRPTTISLLTCMK